MTTPAQAVTVDMLDRLRGIAGSAVGPQVPAADLSVTTTRLSTRGAGLGGFRGGAVDVPSPFAEPEIRVVRLDAEVAVQVWADTADVADTRVQNLHTGLVGRDVELSQLGFLLLRAAGTTVTEPVGPRWRKVTSYAVLYEGRYFDPDAAGQLIARIPIEGAGEPTTVTGSLVRWADDADEPLVVSGPGRVTSIAAAARLPAAIPPVPVTIRRTAGGPGPVPNLPTLGAFLAAVSGPQPAEREADVQFTDLRALLDALGPATPVPPQPDAPADEYGGRVLALSPPIELPTAADRLEFSRAPGPLGAVAYLRAGRP